MDCLFECARRFREVVKIGAQLTQIGEKVGGLRRVLVNQVPAGVEGGQRPLLVTGQLVMGRNGPPRLNGSRREVNRLVEIIEGRFSLPLGRQGPARNNVRRAGEVEAL